MKRIISMVLCFTFLALPLYSDITVDSSAGVSTTGAPTKLILMTNGKVVPIYKILDQSVSMGTGYTTSGDMITMSGNGLSLQLLCEAPAELTLDGGVYQFQLTNGIMFNGNFKVSATGGTQVWEVDNGWGNGATPLIMSGIMSIICGGMMLGLAGSLDSDGTPDWVMPFGIAMTGYGLIALPLGSTNRPKARLVETR